MKPMVYPFVRPSVLASAIALALNPWTAVSAKAATALIDPLNNVGGDPPSAFSYRNVVMDANGISTVVWNTPTAIMGRRFSKTGILEAEFTISTTVYDYTANAAGPEVAAPSIALDGSDGFVVVWSGPADIWARRYGNTGAATGPEFAVVPSVVATPTVGMAADGSFVVSWADADGVNAQRVNASDASVGAAIQVYAGAAGRPVVAMNGSGRMVIGFSDEDTGGFGARILDNAGAQAGSITVANSTNTVSDPSGYPSTTTMIDNLVPDIAMDDTGDFVIAWERVTDKTTTKKKRVCYTDYDGYRSCDYDYPETTKETTAAVIKRYHSDGSAKDVNNNGIELEKVLKKFEAPSVAMDADGDFVVVSEKLAKRSTPVSCTGGGYYRYCYGGDIYVRKDVHAQKFTEKNGKLKKVGGNAKVTSTEKLYESSSNVALNNNGDRAVVWLKASEIAEGDVPLFDTARAKIFYTP